MGLYCVDMVDKPPRETLVAQFHDEDMTQSEMAEVHDVSQWTISQWMQSYDIDTRKPRNEAYINDLRRVARELGHSPSHQEYREHGEYSAGAIQKRFDGWNAAKEAADLETNPPSTAVSQDELLEDLDTLAEELGRSPTQADINEHTSHSHKTYYRNFEGGLQEAKERVGVEVNQSGERVTVDCANCGSEIERLESDVSEKENVFCDRECLGEYRSEKYSGDGNPMSTLVEVECEACGDTVKKAKWDRERYDMHFCDNDCYSQWCSDVRHGENHPVWTEYPTIECEWCGAPFKVKPAKKNNTRFCSWECSNNWKSDAYAGEGNHNWVGGRDKYMGANWPEQRQKALLRDQARCQKCGLPESEHIGAYGRGLHVHHITPRREFRQDGNLDWEAANRLENLITLCNACHSEVEASNT